MSTCHVCRENACPDLPPRERILVTEHWRVCHAFDTSLEGWLVVDALEHVGGLHELPPEAHRELGDLVGRLSTALVAELGCAKTYVMQFSEAAGFAHLHVHVVPRSADLPPESRGAAIFRHLGPTAVGDRVTPERRDDVARRLAARLSGD